MPANAATPVYLASDMQHWAARNNIIASFSFCSKCRFWECDSTLLGYQTLRASAAFVWSSPTSDCRTQDRNNWLPLVFPPFWWCEMTSAARKSLQLQSGALKKPKSTPSLSRRNIPAWWWCVSRKKTPPPHLQLAGWELRVKPVIGYQPKWQLMLADTTCSHLTEQWDPNSYITGPLNNNTAKQQLTHEGHWVELVQRIRRQNSQVRKLPDPPMNQKKWWQSYKKWLFFYVKTHTQSPVLISTKEVRAFVIGVMLCETVCFPSRRTSHTGGAVFIWQLQQQILIYDPNRLLTNSQKPILRSQADGGRV